MTDPGRIVTQDDVDLVLESMIEQETGWLRRIGSIAEALGWLAVVAALVSAGVRWNQLLGDDGFGVGGSTLEDVVTFVLPQLLTQAALAMILVLLGRGARVFALHLAAQRGINATGLSLGEPLAIDLEEDGG